MKKLIIWVLAFMLMFTEVLFSLSIYAEGTTDECESMVFKVEEPIVGEEKLLGEGQAGQEIELTFKNIEEILEVEEDGTFKYEWKEEMPEKDDTIILKNGPYELELIVKEETTEIEPIEAELIEICEQEIISKDEEIIGDEDQTEEGEEQPENIEELDQFDEQIDSHAEQLEDAEEENSEIEETAEDALVEGEVDSKEENQIEDQIGEDEEQHEDIIEENQETVEDMPGEAESTEIDEEIREDISVKDLEEKNSEEIIEEELAEELDLEVESHEEAVEEETSENTVSTSKTDNKEALVEGETEEVKSEEENSDEEYMEGKLRDEEIENSEDVENKKEEEASDHQRTAEFSSFETAAAVEAKSQVPTKEITGNTRTVTTAADFNDALESGSVEKIFLEADIEQPEPPTVESQSGHKIIETNGYDINLVNGTMVLDGSVTNMIIRGTNTSGRSTNLYTTSSEENDGFIEKEGTGVKLHLENINFNLNEDPDAGKFGSNWEGEVHFYGHNTMFTYKSNNAFTFRELFVHDNATLELDHRGSGAAFVFNRDSTLSGEYGIQVGDYSSLKVHSNSAVIKTTNLGNNNINFDTGHRAIVDLKGTGSVIFDMETKMIFNIDNPERVDLDNTRRGGRLFPDNLELLNLINRSNDVVFNIKDVVLSGWTPGNTTNSASSTSNSIQEGKFTFTTHRPLLIHRETTRVSVLKPGDKNFGDNFKPDMRRMLFAGSSPDEWGFVSAPENIAFETTEIKDEEQVIQRQSSHYDFEIIDTRKNSDWHLSAQAIEPLNDGNGNELEGAIHYFEADGSETLMEEEPVRIVSKNTDGVQQVSWNSNEGILLKMNTIRAEADKEYSATITWTLTDGP